MPLVSFSPTKARLIIENDKDIILVMKVAVSRGETVELASGERLETLSGVVRIRERKANNAKADGVIGSLIFLAESGSGSDTAPAKFQINLGMAPDKFEPLLRVALSGRLPNKFFIDAGERVSAGETRGLSYRSRRDGRTKLWNTTSFPSLPVTSFVMILPIEIAEPRENALAAEAEAEAYPSESMATNAQVAELVADLLAFQGETKYTLNALVAIVGVVALLALVFGLLLLFR
jgi:hypothetical protein